MNYNETLNYLLQSNHMVLNRALAGVSHDESLRILQDTGSNMNWILGHIILSRNGMCRILEHPEIGDQNFQKLFARGTKSHDAVPFHELVDIYNNSQGTITAKVLEFDPSKEEKKSKELAFLCFHEAYHIGQLGLLRRMLGKEGVAG